MDNNATDTANLYTTYDDIVHYAEQVIPIICKHAPNSLILVGTPNFCTSLSEAIENPIEYQNSMYTYYYYAGILDCKFAMEEIARGIEPDSSKINS